MEISLIITLGTGLGATTQRSWDFVLPLSRERVEQMDGDLQVTTAPGQGTKVVVVLPVPGEKTKLALLSGSS
jgi:signal transduction histidine kinase